MFYFQYLIAELRRRKARSLLTAFGLAVGIAFVIATGALSSGVSDAQDEVLDPLRGVGTDLSVSRPLSAEGSGS